MTDKISDEENNSIPSVKSVNDLAECEFHTVSCTSLVCHALFG